MLNGLRLTQDGTTDGAARAGAWTRCNRAKGSKGSKGVISSRGAESVTPSKDISASSYLASQK